MRPDAWGFFWQDQEVEKRHGEKLPQAPRALPSIPENGWKIPTEFPRLEKAKLIGLDTETKDLELIEKGPGVRRGAHIVGISVGTEDGHAWYFPMRHELGENLPPENVIRWAQDNLTRPNQPKVGANILYDLDFLAHAGVNVEGPFFDIQIAEALLDENAHSYDLDSIAHRHLGKGKVTTELEAWCDTAYGRVAGGDFRANIYRAPSTLTGPYAEGDVTLPIEILQRQLPRLKAEKLDVVWDIESRLIPMLLAMRRRGVRINLKKAQTISDRLTQQIAEDQARLKDAAGFDVNVDAKEHLIKLFDQLGLTYPRTPPSSRFPEGQPSFVKEFLEHHDHPIAKLISSTRRWEKFKGTFIEGYIQNLHINGRIHCMFNQTRTDDYGTVSGRLSSSLPNLQNIPVRDLVWGPLIRSLFIPDLGERWGRIDWSQIEYRILVHLAFTVLKGEYGSDEARRRYSEDPKTDYHQFVSDITSVIRDHAKNINFGFVYGMGADELARQLGLTLDAATPIFDQYHSALPFVKQIRDAASANAGQQGHITTLLGRRRRFDLWAPRYRDEGAADGPLALPQAQAMGKWGSRLRRAYTHKALNAEIQGSAADLMKLAMVEYWERRDLVNELGPALLTVHDEQDFSVPRTKAAKEAFYEVQRLMETCLQISVPIIAEANLGKDWGATK